MMLEMKQCPSELRYINNLKRAGIVITLADYRKMASLNRDDLILWNDAEAQRIQDEQELRNMGR